LSQWAGQQTSAKALRAATAAIMADVTALVAKLRDEEPPAVPYDPSPVSRTIPADSRTATGSAAAPATEAGADST
jgi:hypothetical protein